MLLRRPSWGSFRKKAETPEQHLEQENVPGLTNHAPASEASSPKSGIFKRKKGHASPDEGRRRPVLFDITVEVEDGRKMHVQMREGDTAEEVATRFCMENRLPGEFVLPLKEHIVSNLPTSGDTKPEDAAPQQHVEVRTNHEVAASTLRPARRVPESRPAWAPIGGMPSQRREKRKMYSDRHSQRKRPKRRMEARQLAARQFQNYGELLYWEGLCSMEAKSRVREIALEEQMNSELEGVTWTPKISKMAQKLERKSGDVFKRLHRKARSENRLQALRKEAVEQELMECTFKPQILPVRDVTKLIFGSVTRFDLLYWDAESRLKRKAQNDPGPPEGTTFSPSINYAPGLKDREPRGNVFARLFEYAVNLTKKPEKLLDSETGQKLFTPAIRQWPMKRNKRGLPVFDYLYQMKPFYDSKKMSIADKYFKKWKAATRKPCLSPLSQKLSKQFEERTLHELFEYLDADKDGLVDLRKVKSKPLTSEVVRNIAEANKLPESDKPLAVQDFVNLMLKVQTRKRNGLHLILADWKKKGLQKLVSRIKMSKTSRLLAARRRNLHSHDEWYTVILSDQENVQKKVERLRMEKELQEADECRFRPILRRASSPKIVTKNTSRPVEATQVTTNIRLEEGGVDDVHGYIIKETTQIHEKKTSSALAQPEAIQRNTGLSGWFQVWRRLTTTKPAGDEAADPDPDPADLQMEGGPVLTMREPVAGVAMSRKPLGFLSDIPEPGGLSSSSSLTSSF